MADETIIETSGSVLIWYGLFLFLFFLTLIALTWMINLQRKQYLCSNNPSIWCSNNWTCNTTCPASEQYNSCFTNLGTTGLASCLFGVNAPGANYCYNDSEDTSLLCACTAQMNGAQNCFSGCASSISDVNNTIPCCSKGSTTCPKN